MVAWRKARQNDYQRRYRGKPEVAERTLHGRRDQARKHEKTYWPRFRLACRLAKERGDRHLAPEHLAAVGLQAPTLNGRDTRCRPSAFGPTPLPLGNPRSSIWGDPSACRLPEMPPSRPETASEPGREVRSGLGACSLTRKPPPALIARQTLMGR